MRNGALIDATLVAAAVKPPQGNAGEVSERDPEAGWTKKNGKSHFGYKAHIAVDEGSKIIRDAILTSADLHDSQRAASLIQGDEKAVYGDKAYALLWRHCGRSGRGGYRRSGDVQGQPEQAAETVADLVQQGGGRDPLRRRAPLCGDEASLPGFRRARYIGLERNACHLQLLCTAINLKRALVLAA